MKKNKVPKMEYSGKEPSKFRANHKLKDRTVDGLVITDPMGQWAHPGQITRISSNDITMQGVPYPVFGIDDTGHSQMMYPGADYTFPGQYVTEYPMAKEGGWLDEYDNGGNKKIDFEGSRRKPTTGFAKSQIEAQEILDAQKKSSYKKPDLTEYYREKTYKDKDHGTVKKHIPQSTLSKALEVTANPFTALKNYNKTGYIPDHFSQDSEESMLSPIGLANIGFQGLTSIGNAAGISNAAYNAPSDLAEGNYLGAGLNALDALPGIAKISKNAKKLQGIPDNFSGEDLKDQIKNASEYFKNLGYGTKELLKKIPKNIKWRFDNYEDLQKLPSQYKNAIKEITTPEGLKRLKNLGVDDPNDFIKYLNNVKINATTEGSHFFPVGPGSVNINPGQVKKLKKETIPLTSQEGAIDHELGHAIQYYLENKGKTFNRLTDLDIEAVDELYPHITNNVSNFFENTRGMNYASAKDIAKNLGESSSNYLFRNKREPLAHLRETKRAMVENNIINNIHENITPKHIEEFILKGGDKDRILSFLQQTPEAKKTLAGLLNKTPALIPIGVGALGAKNLQEEEGGWLELYNDDEYKRGGQKGLKSFTSKNIQTSVNDLMMRNELLFGPSGKRRYKPDLKYNNGGSTNNWLDDI